MKTQKLMFNQEDYKRESKKEKHDEHYVKDDSSIWYN